MLHLTYLPIDQSLTDISKIDVVYKDKQITIKPVLVAYPQAGIVITCTGNFAASLLLEHLLPQDNRLIKQ